MFNFPSLFGFHFRSELVTDVDNLELTQYKDVFSYNITNCNTIFELPEKNYFPDLSQYLSIFNFAFLLDHVGSLFFGRGLV